MKTKTELNDWLNEELHIGKYKTLKLVLLWLKGSERYPICKFWIALRHYEYYLNKNTNNVFHLLLKQFWRFKFRHYQLKFDLHIEPNTIGRGGYLMHPGFRKIPDFVTIGTKSTILPMVLIGKAHPGANVKVVIGNNCYISTGVTILAPVRIGNNVVIGAGAVVNKDIPDDCTVVGVPAHIIKTNSDVNTK